MTNSETKRIIRPEVTLEGLNKMCLNNMGDHLGIEFTEIGPDYLIAKMPVDRRTVQPMGILHGGASVALAETVGSVAANCVLDENREYAVGLDINANHLRSATKGYVFAKATPLHVGKKTQVWEIKITSDDGKNICISRLTMAVVSKKEAFTPAMVNFKVSGE